MRPGTKLACRACRQRKMRCDGEPPSTCGKCAKHGLECIYGSAGHRGSRLGISRGRVIARQRFSPESPATFSDAYFLDLIPLFLSDVYPLCPVVTEEEIRYHAAQRESNDNSAALIYAWAGILIFHKHAIESSDFAPVNAETSTLISWALRHSRPIESDQFTFDRLIATLFLEWSMIVIGKIECGFLYLRQAISLVQVLLLNTDDLTLDRDRLNDIYWLCFVHERLLAVMFRLPICLDPLPPSPSSSPHSLECGFNCLIQTYMLVDSSFLSAWRSDTLVPVTTDWIEQKHRELTDSSWLLAVGQLSLIEQADLITTRCWLCTLLWQIAISNLQLSSESASSDPLSLSMPLHILAPMRMLLRRLGPVEVAMHAFSLVYKLFEITTTIADVLLQLPPSPDEDENQRRIDDFLLAKNFLFGLLHLKPAYREALVERTHQINAKYGLKCHALQP